MIAVYAQSTRAAAPHVFQVETDDTAAARLAVIENCTEPVRRVFAVIVGGIA